jgi:hypothetical protein
MLKQLFVIIYFLNSIAPVLATNEEHYLFCNNDAIKRIAELNKSPGHAEALKNIEDKNIEYNANLATQTIATDFKVTSKSALLSEILQEVTEEINASFAAHNNNYENISFAAVCKNKPSMRLCLLPPGKQTTVETTIKNLVLAATNASKGQLDPANTFQITAPDLTNSDVKKQIGGGEITDDELASLNNVPAPNRQNSPIQKKLLQEISDINNNKLFKDTESLKKYIAERYLRSCSQTSKPVEVTSICGAESLPPVYNFNIANDSFRIIGALAKQQDGNSTFSKEEIKRYKEICDRNKSEPSLKESSLETCRLVYQDYNEIKLIKEPKDWEAIHKKNYVISDPTNKDGYRIVPKATNTELFLGAFAPLFTSFAPFWIYNIQAGTQIEMMTQQGMMQKQAMANYNAYSSGYFNANYLPTNSTTPSLSAGFNFGP